MKFCELYQIKNKLKTKETANSFVFFTIMLVLLIKQISLSSNELFYFIFVIIFVFIHHIFWSYVFNDQFSEPLFQP